ncbi:MAG: response regulator [Syntrophobacteraceae bacterium]|jgi:signal transduction histidine kinase|nr:response regulator [Syntrophobacteraceae bacterium]
MKPPRILVVEDEAIVSRDISDRLETMGYQAVGMATSGEECLEMVSLRHPDLVLMDIRIDGPRDGVETAEAVRSRFNLPVIFLTAFSEDVTIERAKRAEPYGFIIKPFGDRELRSAIEIALYKHHAEREKLQARAAQAQRLESIGTLAGGIAHDFNNILAPIVGYTEIVLGDMSTHAPQRELLEQVLRAGGRARQLVGQILAFSRNQHEQPIIPMNVDSVVKEALKLLKATLPATIEVRQHIEEGTALVDGTQIHQIIVNLCTNAAHAMAGSGVLQVSLRNVSMAPCDMAALSELDLQPGAYLRLRVEDSGCGMNEETMGRIFEPYFTTKAPGEGTGLGLAVVHGIVQRHGGAIAVRSEAGRGSVFEIYLPAAQVEPESLTDTYEDLPGGSEGILLVDDDEMVARTVATMLLLLGYDVKTRTSAVEALELFQSDPGSYDLVIADFTMPEMTGVDLAREMLRERPGMPFILCTGFNERLTEETAREVGVREVAMKPLGRRQLAGLVRRCLDAASTEPPGNA